MKYQSKTTGYSFNGSNQYAVDTTVINQEPSPAAGTSKKSFLVFKHNKYIMVPTETIAFFYIKFGATMIVTFDKQEYSVHYTLEQIQQFLSELQFFRLNRQYLISLNAIKEVEYYFARKLLVTPILPFPDKLIVSKEKARNFLDWLESR
jgi:two-component system response regulator LytT